MTSTPKRRGRPPAFSADAVDLVLTGDPRCRRTALNIIYAGQAMSLLGLDQPGHPFPHLYDATARLQSRQGAIKMGVLTEIGRIAKSLGPQVAFAAARMIEAALAKGTFTTAADAASYLRRAIRLAR